MFEVNPSRTAFHGAILAVALSLGCIAPVNAVDLGAYGETRPIPDVDMRLALAQSMQGDVANGKAQLKESAKNYGDSLFTVVLSPATKNYGVYIDPSFELPGDITAPVRDDAGNWGWQVVWKKGQKINPLESQSGLWTTNLLFLDVNDEEQLNFARQVLKGPKGLSLMLVATAGNPFKATDKLGEPVMALNQLLMNRFKLEHVPAMAGVGLGPHTNHFAVTYFAPPYKASAILSAWNGWQKPKTPQEKKKKGG